MRIEIGLQLFIKVVFPVFENEDHSSLLPDGKKNGCYKLRLNINLRTVLKYLNMQECHQFRKVLIGVSA